MTILIEPTTSAVSADSSKAVKLGQGRLVISAPALAGSEEVAVEYSAHGEIWSTADDDVGPIKLTASSKQVLVSGAGFYRVSKTTTASACGVYAVQ